MSKQRRMVLSKRHVSALSAHIERPHGEKPRRARLVLGWRSEAQINMPFARHADVFSLNPQVIFLGFFKGHVNFGRGALQDSVGEQ